MSDTKKVLILAPHIDDEAIGCWSVLHSTGVCVHVVYFFDTTDMRRNEAARGAADAGFSFSIELFETYIIPDGYEEVYVPSRKDWHVDHKRVNAKYRNEATHFYSVDMAEGKPLAVALTKLNFLNVAYSSQAALWQNDHKYWLFEDIQTTDYDEYSKLAWSQPNGAILSITVLNSCSAEVIAWCNLHGDRNQVRKLLSNSRAFMDSLLEICEGKVTVEYGSIRIEA